MKTQDWIKWILIGGAALLVVKYLYDKGYFASLLGAGTTGTGAAGAGTGAATGTGTPATTTTTTTTTAPPATVAAPSDATIKQAVADPAQAAVTGAYTMNWDQWNWYRSAVGASFGISVDTVGPENIGKTHADQFTAAQYHAGLAQLGMDGAINQATADAIAAATKAAAANKMLTGVAGMEGLAALLANRPNYGGGGWTQ